MNLQHGNTNMSLIEGKEPRILIIEDTPISRKILEVFCDNNGFKNYITAVNGAQGIEEFKRGCDLVILDIGLPDISGIEICRFIREYESINSLEYTPIIIQSANGNSMLAAAIQAGASFAMQKPFSFEKLREVMQFWLNHSVEKEVKNGF